MDESNADRPLKLEGLFVVFWYATICTLLGTPSTPNYERHTTTPSFSSCQCIGNTTDGGERAAGPCAGVEGRGNIVKFNLRLVTPLLAFVHHTPPASSPYFHKEMSAPPQGMPPMLADGQDMSANYYPPENDLTGGLPINLDSLRDGPPGSKPFYPYSTLIRCVSLSCCFVLCMLCVFMSFV
jgi:hypothetical protein